MYETHRVEDRIVSISQPHVRPIVRGKVSASTEFGAKVAISLVNGDAFLENLSWNNFNEGNTLIASLKTYKHRFGYYPFTEGLCVQIMHIGPYSDEARSVALLKAFIETNGLVDQTGSERKHHEIYLSDPRKTVPEKLKTVLRHPVAHALF